MPLIKGKDIKRSCNDYGGISLLSVSRNVYGKVLTERLIEIIKGKASE